MTQKICPRCQYDNALENDFCGRCGARLETALTHRRESPLSIGQSSRLPAPLVRQVVRAATASLLAIAADAGLAWLRRRSEPETSPTVLRPTPIERKEKQRLPAPTHRGVTIFSRRIIQVWERGRLRGEGVEESVWRWHDEI